MSLPTSRPAYAGKFRNIVIAIDFGTTFSGVSYAVLEPGAPSQVRSVTGFPGQEDNSSSTKVPTILYYDRLGKVRAAGAQTNDPDIMEGYEEWIKLDWFKFLLRPRETYIELPDAPSPQLPEGKTFPMVLGDFLSYLNGCATDYIRRTHADGDSLWAEVSDRVEYVLSHPNGWDGFQQGQMRSGAICGRLVPDTEVGRGRIHFVSEGEASFHWCVESGLASGSLKAGNDIVVADAGGGTIDVSAFRVKTDIPLKLEETKPAECRLAGSVFVTHAFDRYIRLHLQGSSYGDSETRDHLVSEFERKSKRIFRETSSSITIQFGRPTDAPEPAFGIKSGRLAVSREAGVQFFEQSIAALTQAVELQIQGNTHTTVFLVGGFAASPYMLAELERRLAGHNVSLKRAESHTAKAVADGAVGYFLDHYIDARVAKYTYGVFGNPVYNAERAEHVDREHKVYTEVGSGRRLVPGKFFPHVFKGAAVRETAVHTEIFCDSSRRKVDFEARFILYCYKGRMKDIQWKDEDPNNFRPVCTFSAVLPRDALTLGKGGAPYWRANYSAVVTFGTTEFTCHIEWKDQDGTIQRGRMMAVWDEG